MYQNERFQVGKLAFSKAGHDKDSIYVIIKSDQEYVYLVDGVYKKLEKPKKKRIKHIQIINEIPANIAECLETGRKVTDEDIKRAIKIFSKQ
ncbi:KOW domain-containing RNA-binding protein [Anaerosporobacter faecicola]|uniref:KOW domain-containing RNA-binding protein n=1 Tax=Anaerosporobacter faecicola TaxID=2718714 RepID=UPI001439A853|nr:KOW domain-containing RNA-binding protein [Anaerosporobacter faecicola]